MPTRFIRHLLIPALLLIGTNAAAATQFTVCIAAPGIKNNPMYYHMPNTQTRLLCELGNTKSRPTLRNLYRGGWRLIHVESIKPTAKKKNPSPILYLEREVPDRQAAKPKQKKPTTNFFEDLL